MQLKNKDYRTVVYGAKLLADVYVHHQMLFVVTQSTLSCYVVIIKPHLPSQSAGKKV